MTRTIKAELLKLMTTRAMFGILLGAIAVNVIAFVAPGENIVNDLGKPLHQNQSVFLIGFLMRVLLLVFGIRAITDEWRYGTITPSLLAIPERGRFLLSKTIAAALAGTLIALAATAAMVVAAYAVAAGHDVGFNISSDELVTLAGMVAAGTLWTAIGVGFGTIVKSQLFATVSGLVWLMALEDAVRHRFDDVASYLPGQAGIVLALAPSEGLALRGAAVLSVYALIALIVGSLLLRRRDVS